MCLNDHCGHDSCHWSTVVVEQCWVVFMWYLWACIGFFWWLFWYIWYVLLFLWCFLLFLLLKSDNFLHRRQTFASLSRVCLRLSWSLMKKLSLFHIRYILSIYHQYGYVWWIFGRKKHVKASVFDRKKVLKIQCITGQQLELIDDKNSVH